MDEKELGELTRKTAERLLGPLKPGEGVYALWREFDPELASRFRCSIPAACTRAT